MGVSQTTVQLDRHRRATPRARIYSGGVVGLAQKTFPIAQPRKKALKTIAQESRRRACLRPGQGFRIKENMMIRSCSCRSPLLLSARLPSVLRPSSRPIRLNRRPQTAAPALPPGSPMIGRPAARSSRKARASRAATDSAAVDKLPTAKLKVPPGFNIEVYAAGMANARSLAEGDKGTVFVGSRLVDKVYAIVNKDGKRTVKVLAWGSTGPTASPSATARSTSPSFRRYRRSSMSKTISTIRRSQPSSTTTCRRMKPTAGNSSPSDPTTSCMSRSGSPATTSCMMTRMVRSGG